MARPGGAPPRAALHWKGKIDGAYGEAVLQLRTRVRQHSRADMGDGGITAIVLWCYDT